MEVGTRLRVCVTTLPASELALKIDGAEAYCRYSTISAVYEALMSKRGDMCRNWRELCAGCPYDWRILVVVANIQI